MVAKNDAVSEQRPALNREHRWLIPGLLALILFGGYTWMQWSVHRTDGILRANLLDHAVIIARAVSGEPLDVLSFTAEDATRDEFHRICSQMRACAETLGLRSLYSMALRDGQIVFGPENLSPDDPYASPPGTVYEEPSPADLEIFKSGKAFVQGPQTDEYGTFITAVVPVFNPRTGGVLLTIGLDLEASEWQAALLRARYEPVLFTVVLLVILLAGSLIMRSHCRTDSPLWNRHHAEVAVIATALLTLTCAAARTSHDAECRLRDQTFRTLAQVQAAGISEKLRNLQNWIVNLKHFFECSTYVDRSEFERYAEAFTAEHVTRSWVWIPEVRAADTGAFEADARRTGLSGFSIWQRDAQGGREPAGGRDRFYPALYIEPQAGQDNEFGYDWGSDPGRRAAIEETLHTGLPAVAALEPCLVLTNKPSGMFIVQSAQSATQRGVIAAAFCPEMLLRTYTYRSGEPSIKISADLFLIESGKPPRFLAGSSDKGGPAGLEKDYAGLSVITPVFLFGQSYALLIHPEPAWLAAHPLRNGWQVGAIGLTLTALLTALIAFLANRPALLEKLVQQRTAELLRLSTAIEQSPEAVVITNPDGIIEYVNPSFETISGYSREETVGKTPRILKSGQYDASLYSNLWETITSGENWKGRLVNKRKSGEFYTEETTIAPVRDADGTITGYVAVKRDITEELATEERFRQSQKMEAVGHLAGGIAHDFNNLLQAILGFSEILLGNFKEETAEHRNIAEIQKAAWRAAEITKQLLAFSRKQPVDRKRIDLNTPVRDAVLLLQLLLGEKIQCHLELEPVLHEVYADHGQLTQIIMNLAINARDAMPDGGRLTITTENITFEPQAAAGIFEAEPGSFVCLSITDTGCGMSQEVKDRLFEPFFTTKKVGQGTGLGLAVVYGIVKQNKGWIHVYSEEGLGTTFKVYLPVCEPAAQDKPETPSHTERILLVEDEEEARNLAIRIMSTAGYKITAVSSAEEALQLFEQEKGLFDLLFSDIILPGKNGVELANTLRIKNQRLPVLLCSGYQNQRQRWNDIDSKGYHFLQKPFTVAGLLNAVHEAISEKV